MTDLTKQPKTETLQSIVASPYFREQVAKALPRHCTPDRFIRAALTCMLRTPKLAQCSKPSFLNAMLTLSQLGIEADGRRAHLIPFENRKAGTVEVQLIIDYKGIAELAMRSGVISNLHADVVCENDEFEQTNGTVTHKRAKLGMPRGKAIGAMAICTFKDGTSKSEVMDVEEIEAVRNRSRAGQSGPWVTDWNEMAKKTVFRRLSKWLPLSPELRDAVEADDEEQKPMLQAKAPEMMQIPESVDDDGQVPGAEYPAQESTQQASQQAAGPATMSQNQAMLKEACESNGAEFLRVMAVLFADKADTIGDWSEVPEAVAASLVKDARALMSAIKKAKA